MGTDLGSTPTIVVNEELETGCEARARPPTDLVKQEQDHEVHDIRTDAHSAADSVLQDQTSSEYQVHANDDVINLQRMARIAKKRAADLAVGFTAGSASSLSSIQEEAQPDEEPSSTNSSTTDGMEKFTPPDFKELSNKMTLSLDLSMLLSDMLACVVEQMETLKLKVGKATADNAKLALMVENFSSCTAEFQKDSLRETEESRVSVTRLFAEALRAERDARHEQVLALENKLLEEGAAHAKEVIEASEKAFLMKLNDLEDSIRSKVTESAKDECRTLLDARTKDIQSRSTPSLQEKVQEHSCLGALCSRMNSLEQQLSMSKVQPAPLARSNSPVSRAECSASPVAVPTSVSPVAVSLVASTLGSSVASTLGPFPSSRRPPSPLRLDVRPNSPRGAETPLPMSSRVPYPISPASLNHAAASVEAPAQQASIQVSRTSLEPPVQANAQQAPPHIHRATASVEAPAQQAPLQHTRIPSQSPTALNRGSAAAPNTRSTMHVIPPRLPHATSPQWTTTRRTISPLRGVSSSSIEP